MKSSEILWNQLDNLVSWHQNWNFQIKSDPVSHGQAILRSIGTRKKKRRNLPWMNGNSNLHKVGSKWDTGLSDPIFERRDRWPHVEMLQMYRDASQLWQFAKDWFLAQFSGHKFQQILKRWYIFHLEMHKCSFLMQVHIVVIANYKYSLWIWCWKSYFSILKQIATKKHQILTLLILSFQLFLSLTCIHFEKQGFT